MPKLLFLIIFLTSLVNAKPFNQTIIMIEPVSWEELQKLEFNDLKTKEELNLSNTCPTELDHYNGCVYAEQAMELLWFCRRQRSVNVMSLLVIAGKR